MKCDSKKLFNHSCGAYQTGGVIPGFNVGNSCDCTELLVYVTANRTQAVEFVEGSNYWMDLKDHLVVVDLKLPVP